jgi:hypothetical protein
MKKKSSRKKMDLPVEEAPISNDVSQAEAEASARAVPGFKAISGSVKVGYSWTTSYTYTETTYTGCENPSF